MTMLLYRVRARLTLMLLAVASVFRILADGARSLARIARPFPGWQPVYTGGNDAGDPAPAPGMTIAEIQALMVKTATEALGPIVTKAFEPIGEAQKSMLTLITKARTDDGSAAPEFDEKTLGKYPIGRKIKALAMARLATNTPVAGTPDEIDAAVKEIKKHWPATVAEPTVKWLAHAKEMHTKATHLAGNAQVAGDMIMPAYDERWIELLTAKARVRSIAGSTPMPKGSTTRRRHLQDATSYYQGEQDRMTPSNIKVDRVNLAYKKLTTLCVLGNDLIRFAGSEADRRVEMSMVRSQALREDRAFLVGNPPTDAGSPQGIQYQTDPANVFATAGASLANFQADLTSAISRVESADIEVNEDECVWIMSPATKWIIYALATTTGDWVFRDEIARGRLLGFRILTTTQLSVSRSWIGANAGRIFFVHGPSLEIHDSMQRSVQVYPGGAYYDPALAAVASGISNDETVITCISEHDFFQTYGKAAAIITGYAT